tara:strand:- start:105 stop:839 length:735 start_codon:yes stop_codon:yes gene_type:complete
MHDPNNNNRLRVVSWNMCNHADGWAYLVDQLKPSIAFIQGATEIPSGINPILIHSGEEAASNTLIYACHNSPIELRSTVALGNGITAAYFSAPHLGGLFVFDGHSQSAPPIQAIKRFAKNLNPFVRWFRSSDPQHLLLSGGYQPEGLKEYGEHKRLKAPIVDARKDFEHGLAKIGFENIIRARHVRPMEVQRHANNDSERENVYFYTSRDLAGCLDRINAFLDDNILEIGDHNPVVADFKIGGT